MIRGCITLPPPTHTYMYIRTCTSFLALLKSCLHCKLPKEVEATCISCSALQVPFFQMCCVPWLVSISSWVFPLSLSFVHACFNVLASCMHTVPAHVCMFEQIHLQQYKYMYCIGIPVKFLYLRRWRASYKRQNKQKEMCRHMYACLNTLA